MARTPSNMLPLGTKAPEFTLWNPSENILQSLSEIKGKKGSLLVFMCNHCPFVHHIIHELVSISKEYLPKDIAFIAINSNDVVHYPEDHPDKMKEYAQKWNLSFPYLYDETQEVAKAYDAACTPDFFLFNDELSLVYRGQMDASRPGNETPVDGKDVRLALEHLLHGTPQEPHQMPSIGCNIKWKE